MSWLLVIGAKSDMARATAREFAKHGFNLYLAGRGKKDLDAEASDITIRFGVEAKAQELDLLDYKSHSKFYASLKEKPAGILLFAGYLGDQAKAQSDFTEASRIMETNYVGCVSILNIIADDFEQRGEGFIIGVSSVAGDRGRKSNYIYGSAKAALTAYLSGLRNRLAKSGVHVMTVKPGFARTKMTEGLELPARLTASPEEVARDIFRAHMKKKNVLYTRSIWRLIMLIIRHIPEPIFKKTNL